MWKLETPESGFTLIEVLMVIGLLAILSVGSIVYLSSTSDEYRFRKTTEQLLEIREALVGKFEPGVLGHAPGIALSPAWAPQSVNLIGLWHLDEIAGPALTDSSGSGNTGTTVGTVSLSAAGKIKTALQANGTGGWSASLNLAAIRTVTVAAWFNANACTDPSECILWEFSPNASVGTGFAVAPFDSSSGAFPASSFTFSQSNTSGRMVKYASAPSSGWHHLAVIYDRTIAGANTITAYLDGALLGLTATTFNNNAGDFFGNSTLYFLGRLASSLSLRASIDEVAVWSSALSAAEVQNIYQKQANNTAPAVRKSFGYLGDVGSLPTLAQGLSALWANPGLPAWSMNSATRIGSGWNGKYLNQAYLGADYSKDGWGRSYLYDPTTTPPTLTSLGADGAVGGVGLNTDISVSIPLGMRASNVQGVILNKGSEWSGNAEVELNAPNGAGVLAQTLVGVIPADKGAFQLASVPQGIRSATVYIPSKAAVITTQGPFLFTLDRATASVILQTDF